MGVSSVSVVVSSSVSKTLAGVILTRHKLHNDSGFVDWKSRIESREPGAQESPK